MTGTAAPLEQRAAALGVVDALLFRRLSSSTWAHLGGLGRGRGWAGLVEVDVAQDPLLAQVPAQPGGVYTVTHRPARRVLGPYYAVGVALVRVSNDVVVVLGNPAQALSPDSSEAELRQLASAVDSELADIAPSKRLADELEVLHTVRAVTTGSCADLTGTLQHILEVAVQSLSCELGLLRTGAGTTVATSSWAGVDLDNPAISSALDVLQDRADGGSLCLQDVGDDPALVPLGRAQGVQSVLAVSIPAPVGGVLVVAHTSAGPRGFTSLCQQLGAQVATAASVVAHTAALRDELRTLAEVQFRAARCDALTGLGNRLAWDEALVEAQARVDEGSVATIITLDLDGLKQVNDTGGHAAGDRLLQRCAEVLREHSRPGDVIARLGGDEFALLLPVSGPLAEQRVAALRNVLSGVASGDGTVAASLGAATTRSGDSVAAAAREADAAMYRTKQVRRRADRRGGSTPVDPAGGRN